MELYKGDLNVIKQEIETLRNKICSCKNSNEVKEIYLTLDTLIETYECLSGKTTNYYRKLRKNKYYYNETNRFQRKLYTEKINCFIKNKQAHSSLANDMLIAMEEKMMEFPYYNTMVKQLNEKQILEIVDEYLTKLNNGSKEVLEQLIKEKRIFNSDVDAPYDGYTTLNNNLGKCNILVNGENSVTSMITLVHELGHVIDFNKMLKNKSQKDSSNSYTKSAYNEVISLMYERDFIEYLIKNNIEKENSLKDLENHYISMFDNIQDMLILANMDDYLLEKERYMQYDKENIFLLLNQNCEVLGDIDEFPEPSSLDIIDACNYSYGGIIANYLLGVKKNSRVDFDKMFTDFYGEREKDFDERIYEVLKTDKEGLIKGVKQEMNTMSKVKKY